MKFASGYSYIDFENYLTNEIGNRILTSNFNVRTTSKGWAYTDEEFVGDYYIKNSDLSLILPWWVNDISFQVLNGELWLPENGGYKLSSLNAKHKSTEIRIENNSPVCYVGSSINIDMPAINVSIYNKGKLVQTDVSCIYDLYYPIIKADKFYISSVFFYSRSDTSIK
jgi:hypothetical protein